MNTKTRRKASALVLLTLYVSILLFSCLHIHSESFFAANECEQCVHHLPHSGHLTAGDGLQHVCLLCQFLSLHYVAAAVTALILYNKVCARHYDAPLARIGLTKWGIVGLRAPPFRFV